MNKHLITASALLAGLFVTSLGQAAEQGHWGYQGHQGPDHWGELSPAYETCGTGKNQSPINLTGMVDAKLSPLAFAYSAGGEQILNNGHTVQVNYQAGNSLTVDGHTFELKQFHFHSPSENTIEGESFPMEAHFVHADGNGNLAVVALMFRAGEENAELEKAWKQMPAQGGDKADLLQIVNAATLLPANKAYYRFNGSLTTPPCSEGVTWLVLKEAQTASAAQIEHFTHTMHHDNNRPVQPLNARVVLQ